MFWSVFLAPSLGFVARAWRLKRFSGALYEIMGKQVNMKAPQVTIKSSGIRWPETVVTDARDVYDRLAKETGGILEQKALTMEIAIVREWLLASGAILRWTADENMIGDGLTKDVERSRHHLARILKGNVWSIEREPELVRDTTRDGTASRRRARSCATGRGK